MSLPGYGSLTYGMRDVAWGSVARSPSDRLEAIRELLTLHYYDQSTSGRFTLIAGTACAAAATGYLAAPYVAGAASMMGAAFSAGQISQTIHFADLPLGAPSLGSAQIGDWSFSNLPGSAPDLGAIQVAATAQSYLGLQTVAGGLAGAATAAYNTIVPSFEAYSRICDQAEQRDLFYRMMNGDEEVFLYNQDGSAVEVLDQLLAQGRITPHECGFLKTRVIVEPQPDGFTVCNRDGDKLEEGRECPSQLLLNPKAYPYFPTREYPLGRADVPYAIEKKHDPDFKPYKPSIALQEEVNAFFGQKVIERYIDEERLIEDSDISDELWQEICVQAISELEESLAQKFKSETNYLPGELNQKVQDALQNAFDLHTYPIDQLPAEIEPDVLLVLEYLEEQGLETLLDEYSFDEGDMVTTEQLVRDADQPLRLGPTFRQSAYSTYHPEHPNPDEQYHTRDGNYPGYYLRPFAPAKAEGDMIVNLRNPAQSSRFNVAQQQNADMEVDSDGGAAEEMELQGASQGGFTTPPRASKSSASLATRTQQRLLKENKGVEIHSPTSRTRRGAEKHQRTFRNGRRVSLLPTTHAKKS